MLIEIHATPKKDGNGHDFLCIRSEVAIRSLFVGRSFSKTVEAVWDTGATNTVIPMELAEKLGIPLRDETLLHGMTEEQPSRYCSFRLIFPNGASVFVEHGVATPNAEQPLVIGMDIMKHGVTTIRPDGKGGVYFTFEVKM